MSLRRFRFSYEGRFMIGRYKDLQEAANSSRKWALGFAASWSHSHAWVSVEELSEARYSPISVLVTLPKERCQGGSFENPECGGTGEYFGPSGHAALTDETAVIENPSLGTLNGKHKAENFPIGGGTANPMSSKETPSKSGVEPLEKSAEDPPEGIGPA